MSRNEAFAPWQCPLCGGALQGETDLKCEKGHCFDRAREGYWHLLPVQSMRTKAPGDSKEMVAARRAFLNGKLGLTQAEAVMDLISADGRQGAALANASLNGALAKKIGAEKDALTALQAHLTAWVDFPEEDVPALENAQLVSTLTAVKGELDTLIRNYDAGAVLREGVDCAIVGRPNAGKSTLLNLLAGFDRAIVTPVAGTTRDVVEQAVRLGDIRLNLFDTAGLRETEDAIEAEGIRRSWKKLEEAGLILAVFDGSEPLILRWRSGALAARPLHWSTKRTSPLSLTQRSLQAILPW